MEPGTRGMRPQHSPDRRAMAESFGRAGGCWLKGWTRPPEPGAVHPPDGILQKNTAISPTGRRGRHKDAEIIFLPCTVDATGINPLTCVPMKLTFEQQKEILILQLKHD